jgi:hypothetical protein
MIKCYPWVFVLTKSWTYTLICFILVKHSYFIEADPIEDECWDQGRKSALDNLFRLIFQELNPHLSADLWHDLDDPLCDTFLGFM